MKFNRVLLVFASVAIVSATGELLCSEQSFAGLGGALPSPKSVYEYTTCAGGIVEAIPCPAGHQFDTSTGTCSVGAELPERRTEAIFQFEELCNNPNEVQIFPNPTNCTQYVICFGLVPIEQSCTGGLLFNPDLQTCDIPTNVVCGYSCPAVDDSDNPVWFPDARLQDCARHYLCFQGEPIRFFCSNNLYFDLVTRTCTFPQYSDCRVPGVYCNTTSTLAIENPRSCSSYYLCQDGFPHYRQCSEGEYYSVQQGRCVPGSCEPITTTLEPTSTSTTGTTTTEGTTTTAILTVSTTVESSTLTPETTTTTDFTTTSTTETDSTTVEVSTEESTTTTTEDPSTTTTDFTTTSTAEPSTTTTTDVPTTTTESTSTAEPTTTSTLPPTTTTEMVTIDPNELCFGLGLQVLPYPGNCYMYIFCLENLGTIATCPPNQIFNPVVRACAPGNQETCELA
uniref:Chitin-binding type-2 domain-containing protein n=1 Tax=Anopheles farauti TaxID=69004 RepID=A0A182QN52_9DIPT